MQYRKVSVSRLFVVAVLMSNLSVVLFAQTDGATARFEAASIKQNKSVENAINNRFGPELFSWTNVPLRVLVEQLYHIKDYQIAEAPGWMNTEKWDVTARSKGATTFPQKDEMAKTLLAERFQLKFHWETRELPVYLLTATRNGPRFAAPKDDNDPGGMRIGNGLIRAHKFEIASFANLLSNQLNFPVLDKAELKGIYDFELKWSPVPNEGNFSTRNDAGEPAPSDPSGPTIFTALQEQLGLKLESSKGPVQVLVIDHVEKPSEN